MLFVSCTHAYIVCIPVYIMTYVCDYTRLFFYMRSVFDCYLVVLIAIWLFRLLFGCLDCYLVVRSWSVTLACYCSLISKVLWLKLKGKAISNADAYDKYIKRFKSDWEASGHFISDESLLSEKDQSSKLKKH